MSIAKNIGETFLKAAKYMEFFHPAVEIHESFYKAHEYLTGTDRRGVELALVSEWNKTFEDYVGPRADENSIFEKYRRKDIQNDMIKEAQKYMDQGMSRLDAQKKVIDQDSILIQDDVNGASRDLSWRVRSSRKENYQRPFTPFEPFRS